MAAVTTLPRRNVVTAIPTTGPMPKPTDLVPKPIGSVIESAPSGTVVCVDGRPVSVCINQTVGCTKDSNCITTACRQFYVLK